VNPPYRGGELELVTLEGGITRKTLLRRGLGGVVVAGSLSSLLAACGSNDASSTGVATGGTPPARATGTLRVALASQPRVFDPTLTFSVAELAITGSIYEGLVTFNEDYSALVPALATSWRVSDDAREWEFTLREGVRFHDGAELDSAAVKRSIEYITRRTSLYGFTVGAPEIDDSDPAVVKFKYRDPFADLARNWSLITVMSPKLLAGSDAAAEKRAATSPAGTGPFRFVGQQQGRDVTLAANADYWNGREPHVETLKFVVVPDESARSSALQAGDIDVVMQVPPNATGTLTSSGKARLVESPTWTGCVLDVACSLKPFDDPRVRQALAYAVDRQAIVDSVLRGDAKLLQAEMPPGLYGYSEPATQYAHDPDKARALLAEAGVTTPLKATLAVSQGAILGNLIVQAIAQQLNDVGFAITPRVLDDAALSKDQFAPERRLAIVYQEMGWVNGGPLHLTLGLMAATSHYRSKQYDALMAKVNSSPDGPVREQALADVLELLARDLPQVPMWAPERVDGTATLVRDYRPPENVFTRFDDAYLAAA
jgi:ABC-type transport system substrate-binding protein